jgi:hypothetical protein
VPPVKRAICFPRGSHLAFPVLDVVSNLEQYRRVSYETDFEERNVGGSMGAAPVMLWE